MTNLPPNKNIPAPTGRNGDLVKRTGTEKAVEDSMRMWYAMRDERDEALNDNSELRVQIVSLQAEKAVLRDRNLELETKYELMLIDFTRIKTALEGIGHQGDSISLAVSEILSISRQNHRPAATPPSAPDPDPLSYDAASVEDLEAIARHFAPESFPEAANKEPPTWLNSNSVSPKPTPSTQTTGNNPPATTSVPSSRK